MFNIVLLEFNQFSITTIIKLKDYKIRIEKISFNKYENFKEKLFEW